MPLSDPKMTYLGILGSGKKQIGTSTGFKNPIPNHLQINPNQVQHFPKWLATLHPKRIWLRDWTLLMEGWVWTSFSRVFGSSSKKARLYFRSEGSYGDSFVLSYWGRPLSKFDSHHQDFFFVVGPGIARNPHLPLLLPREDNPTIFFNQPYIQFGTK